MIFQTFTDLEANLIKSNFFFSLMSVCQRVCAGNILFTAKISRVFFSPIQSTVRATKKKEADSEWKIPFVLFGRHVLGRKII